MLESTPRVSIVIRTKDRASLLRRAIDDILAQTLNDWEAIVVNDGGAVAPVDALVAAREGALNGRLEVIHVNGGTGSMEAAANLGAQRAKGEFVAIHDDDDTWAPEFLSIMTSALDADPQAVAAAAHTEIVFERLEGDRATELGRMPFVPPAEMVTLFDLIQANRVVPIALIVRRSVYDEIGWYDPELKAVGDWEFNLRLVRHGRIPYIGQEPLAFWHQRPHAKGAASNSVFGETLDHMQFDRLVRERALQQYVDQHGAGALMYLSKYIEDTVRYHSLQHTLLRVARRAVGRLRFRRRA